MFQRAPRSFGMPAALAAFSRSAPSASILVFDPLGIAATIAAQVIALLPQPERAPRVAGGHTPKPGMRQQPGTLPIIGNRLSNP